MHVVIHSRYPSDVRIPRGGVESATVNLVGGLSRRTDVQVSVVTLERGSSGHRIDLVGGTPVHRVGVPNIPMAIDVCLGPGSRILGRYVESLRPDVVHFHESHGLGAHTWSLPHVMTVHGFDSLNLPAAAGPLWRLRAPMWHLVERWNLAQHRNLIAIAPYVADQLRRVSRARIFDIANAVPSALFDVPTQTSAATVLFAGWIDRRKNLLGLVRALDEVIGRGHSTARLRVAGTVSDPRYLEMVTAYVSQRGLGHHVEFLGQLSQPELREAIAGARVVGLLSYQENAPMVIAEAMSMGVPVVTSNVCGMPMMVSHGDNGFLVDPDDYRAAADGLEALLFSDAAHAAMSRAAREYARATYHPDHVATQTMAAYGAVVRERGAASLAAEGIA